MVVWQVGGEAKEEWRIGMKQTSGRPGILTASSSLPPGNILGGLLMVT